MRSVRPTNLFPESKLKKIVQIAASSGYDVYVPELIAYYHKAVFFDQTKGKFWADERIKTKAGLDVIERRYSLYIVDRHLDDVPPDQFKEDIAILKGRLTTKDTETDKDFSTAVSITECNAADPKDNYVFLQVKGYVCDEDIANLDIIPNIANGAISNFLHATDAKKLDEILLPFLGRYLRPINRLGDHPIGNDPDIPEEIPGSIMDMFAKVNKAIQNVIQTHEQDKVETNGNIAYILEKIDGVDFAALKNVATKEMVDELEAGLTEKINAVTTEHNKLKAYCEVLNEKMTDILLKIPENLEARLIALENKFAALKPDTLAKKEDLVPITELLASHAEKIRRIFEILANQEPGGELTEEDKAELEQISLDLSALERKLQATDVAFGNINTKVSEIQNRCIEILNDL